MRRNLVLFAAVLICGASTYYYTSRPDPTPPIAVGDMGLLRKFELRVVNYTADANDKPVLAHKNDPAFRCISFGSIIKGAVVAVRPDDVLVQLRVTLSRDPLFATPENLRCPDGGLVYVSKKDWPLAAKDYRHLVVGEQQVQKDREFVDGVVKKLQQ